MPEYYLTRAENEILTRYAGEIVGSIEMPNTLIEMGSGSASKTRLIIETLLKDQPELLFVPVDISASALERSSRVLLQSYPRLRIEAYAAEYFDGLAELAKRSGDARSRFFSDQTSATLSRKKHARFLRAMRSVLRAGDALLLGADLKKDKDSFWKRLTTMRWGLPRLSVAICWCGSIARWTPILICRRFAIAPFITKPAAALRFTLRACGRKRSRYASSRWKSISTRGELIHTENSYKYDLEGIARLAAETGFVCGRTWLDEQKRFSSNLLLAAG